MVDQVPCCLKYTGRPPLSGALVFCYLPPEVLKPCVLLPYRTPLWVCNGPGCVSPSVLVVLAGPAPLEAFQYHPMIGSYPGLPDSDVEGLLSIRAKDVVTPLRDGSSLHPHIPSPTFIPLVMTPR